jgi:pimeloyl-ACP methyl ester carboxylesterase
MYSDIETWDIIYWTILILIIVIVISLICFFTFKRYVLFQPSKDIIWKPECSLEYKNLYLVVGDTKHNDGKGYTSKEIIELKNSKILTFSELQYINVWYFNQFPGNKVVLYYHGNNDNISYREYAVNICKKMKLNLLLLDYRGYGKSSSYPQLHYLKKDASTAYSFVRSMYSPDDIIIWGESLGGIASIYTAAKFECSHLVLLSTFYNLNTIINEMKLSKTTRTVIKKLSYDKNIQNHHYIKRIKCPITIIHSENDDILPYINGELLHNNAGIKNGGTSIIKTFIKIDGSHSHPYFTEENITDLMNSLELKHVSINNTQNINEILNIINNLD